MREAARDAEGVAAAAAASPEPAGGDGFSAVTSALDAAAELAMRDAAAGEAVVEASRALRDLVARLAALAGHFRYPGAENFAAPARASAPPVASLAAARRRKAI